MIIALEGMRFWAPVGFHDEEQIRGNDIRIDVYLHQDSAGSEVGDNLTETLDYGYVHEICAREAARPARLLETLARNIRGALLAWAGPQVGRIIVRVSKINPPLAGPTERAFVEIGS